jgi:hypothetical protein
MFYVYKLLNSGKNNAQRSKKKLNTRDIEKRGVSLKVKMPKYELQGTRMTLKLKIYILWMNMPIEVTEAVNILLRVGIYGRM